MDRVACDYWNSREVSHYRRMLKRQAPLWRFVRTYIDERGIQSCLEPGCGLRSPARKWVPNYHGIDLQERGDAICDDFLTMDVASWVGVDLLLACGILEHTGPWFLRFFQQVARVRARHTIISIFGGLDHRKSSFYRDPRGFWVNSFRAEHVQAILQDQDMAARIEVLGPRSTVIVVEREGG